MYRNKQWKKTERQKKKQENKTKWFKKGKTKYKSVLFDPATPNSKIQQEYSKIINKHKIKQKKKQGNKLKVYYKNQNHLKIINVQMKTVSPVKIITIKPVTVEKTV